MIDFMKTAADEALNGIRNGCGGPFGAVVVRDGKIIGKGHNCVLSEHDPTMHGEVAAIRDACRKIGSHDLKGCTLYTTAYPCPMCLSAAMWANIEKIVYGCTCEDTALLGFRDDVFYKSLSGEMDMPVSLVCESREICLEVFDEYRENRRKKLY